VPEIDAKILSSNWNNSQNYCSPLAFIVQLCCCLKCLCFIFMCFLLAAKERASSSASPTAPSVISWVAENGRTTISAFIPVTIQNSALAGISRICIAIVMSGCHSTLSRTTTKSAAECACSPPPYPRLFQESIYSCELTIYKISLMKWVRPQKESSERISRILSVIPRLTSLGLGKETRIGCPVSFFK